MLEGGTLSSLPPRLPKAEPYDSHHSLHCQALVTKHKIHTKKEPLSLAFVRLQRIALIQVGSNIQSYRCTWLRYIYIPHPCRRFPSR
jgi:hypothetical protein